MIYLIYGVFAWPIACVSYYLRHSSQRFLLLIGLLLYLLLIAFSYKTGSDWINYQADYQDGCVNPNFDIGFRAVCSVFFYLGFDYWYFVAFIKFFYIVCVLALVARINVAPLAILSLYVLLSVVFLENLLRQQVAAAFVLISIISLEKRKVVAFFWIVFAIFFHVSAAACVPLIALYRWSWARRFAVLLSLIFFFLQAFGVFASADLSSLLLENFSGSPFIARVALYMGFERYPLTAGHVLRLFLLVIYTVLYYRARRSGSFAKMGYWFEISYCSVLLMLFYEMVFYDFGVFWMRVREYFTIFLIAFPIVWVRQCQPRLWVPVFSVLTIYALYVFYGIYSLPVFDELYREYANTLFHQVSDDPAFDRKRDLAAEEYWENWRKGELR